MLSYEELTPPERELWDAFPEGRRVDLRTGTAESDDPVAGAGWGAERTVRAAVVAMLLLGAHDGDRGSGTVASLRLAGARVTGRLDLSGAEVSHLFSLEGCRLEEPVRLYGATTRTVVITDSWVPGVDCELARIGGDLDLRRSVVEGGSLNLINARMAGNLLVSDAEIAGTDEWAVLGGGLILEGSVFGQRLITRGGLRLPGAQLLSGLFLQGARLGDTEGVALAAEVMAASSVDCSQGFTAQGQVVLRSARIAGLLSFEDAHLNGDGTALDCVSMVVGELDHRPAAPPSGVVDLRSAQATWFRDSERSRPGKVLLDGFTYGGIRSAGGGSSVVRGGDEVSRRLDWVRRNPGYAPQPYEQLASWYRKIGHDDDARRVLLAKQRHRRLGLSLPARLWGHLLDVTVGYGYRPWMAGVWLLALTLLGTLAFSTHEPRPVKEGEGSPFQPFVYTLDLLVPIGDLGQRAGWYWSEGGLQWLAYLLIAFGWVLTTAIVAGVTRALQKS
ncbi:oxidoreductase [Streptomyces sp. NPDC012600]|uniref:oxidoreductase n=1 Tax=Streptomyces sp. NPDC012600 TaxID=3415005 RepID=UPI003C2E1C04